MPQINLDFIINEKSYQGKSLIISGTATTNSKDLQDEKITIMPEAIKQSFEEYKAGSLPVKVEHGRDPNYGDRIVGSVLSFAVPDNYAVPEGQEGYNPHLEIKVLAEITDPQAIADIESGKLDCFSLAWTHRKREIDYDTGDITDKRINLVELTLTASPANPDCKFHIVTDQDLENTFFKKGQVVTYQNQKALISKVWEKEGQFFYDLDLQGQENRKSMLRIEEINLKTYTTDFDFAALENDILRPILIKKIKDEGYAIPTQQVNNFKYEGTIEVTFGPNREYSTVIQLESNGKANVLKKIKGAIQQDSESENQKSFEVTFGELKTLIPELNNKHMNAKEVSGATASTGSGLVSQTYAPLGGKVKKVRKALTPDQIRIPKLVDEKAWDGAAAKMSLRRWASSDGSGDPDKISWSKYARGFAYVDPSQKENLGGYKFPIYDVSEGKLVLNKEAISTAMAYLNGARSGANVPKQAVYSKLKKAYKELGAKDEDIPTLKS